MYSDGRPHRRRPARPAAAATGGRGSSIARRSSSPVPCCSRLLGVYCTLQRGVFTLEELNLDTAAAMTLLLAATGQTIVLLRGGIDLSIGGMISLGTVLAATQFGDDAGSAALWAVLILAIGVLARRHQRAPHLGAAAAAVPGDARHLVDPRRRRAPHPADRRRDVPAAGWPSAMAASSGFPPRSGCSRCSSFWLWFRDTRSASPSARPARTRSRPSCRASR